MLGLREQCPRIVAILALRRRKWGRAEAIQGRDTSSGCSWLTSLALRGLLSLGLFGDIQQHFASMCALSAVRAAGQNQPGLGTW
jgi:hypothetical protein